jgi:polar amino acid transport system substrate-binding protein
MQAERSAVPRAGSALPAARFRATFAVVFLLCVAAMPASGQVLDRIEETGQIRLGYVTDGRPFTYRNEAGDPAGYAVDLCLYIAEQVGARLGTSNLSMEWIPLAADARIREVQAGGVDLMCVPAVPTLARREEVSFSIPVFRGGNRAIIRRDTSESLRTALEGTPSTEPVWRGSPAAKVLQGTSFAVVDGSTTEDWLAARRAMFQVDAEIIEVQDYASGLQLLLDHRVSVFFGDRALALGAMSEAAHERLVILDRHFTQEPYALPLARGDEDLRLLVDAALSQLYASDAFGELYAKSYREFSDDTREFFLWHTFPEHAREMTSSNRDSGSDLRFANVSRAGE